MDGSTMLGFDEGPADESWSMDGRTVTESDGVNGLADGQRVVAEVDGRQPSNREYSINSAPVEGGPLEAAFAIARRRSRISNSAAASAFVMSRLMYTEAFT